MNDARSQRLPTRWRPRLVIAALLLMSGCQGTTYRSASLPDEFRVPPARNVSAVDLTRLTSRSAGSSQIGPGDVLELTIVSGYETGLSNVLNLRVAKNGTINIPLIGSVHVADLEPADAEQNIATLAKQRGVYQRPYVTVIIRKQKLNKITVVGAVKLQGIHELSRSSSDLLGALAAAEGLSEEASEIVEILRKPQLSSPGGATLAGFAPPGPPRPTRQRVNLADAVAGQSGEYRLNDGDVVMVLPQDPRVVHVLGLVRKPGQFDIPPNEDVHVLDALAWAGGRTMQLADKIHVIRRLPNQQAPITIGVSVREAKANGAANLRLAPGDLVSVEETATTAALDTLKSFIRFGVSSTVPIF